MKAWETPLRAPALLAFLLLCGADPASSQTTRELSAGLTAGGGAVQIRPGREDSWSFGPVLGSRLRWGTNRSAWSLAVDLQPFRTKDRAMSEGFRALYLLPGYETGSAGRKIRFGLGMGVFQFGGGPPRSRETGWVAGAAGSVRIGRGLFLELAWRGARSIRDLSTNLYALQLMRLWR